MRVVLVQDWLVTYRGGEKVLDALCELYPDAELVTLLREPGTQSPRIEAMPIRTSFLQRIPGIQRRYRHFLPLMPAAIEAVRLPPCDLVLSSSHCVAKGVRVPAGARHLAYVHAPMRYMWDRFDDYFGAGRASLPVRLAASAARPWLRRWDRKSSRRIDAIVANSANIAGQIRRVWGRDAEVIPPPVELERFTREPTAGSGQGGYFLWLGALAPYKRVDLALAAFAQTGLPLWIAGSGQERIADVPPNVKILGQVGDGEVPGLLRGARALIFPGEEDFGLTPLEAQASGRPVIAYARGGVLETTTPRTAVYFDEQTPEAFATALRRFDAFEATFDPEAARHNALRFSRRAFQDRIQAAVQRVMHPDSAVSPAAKS